MTAEEFILSLDSNIKIIAIDGRCASGKTTFSEELRKKIGAEIIHTDDFFLPLELRTEQRFSFPGSNIHYERFYDEVIKKLRDGKVFSYKKFDCSIMDYNDLVTINPASLIVVEGAYSQHPVFGNYADLKLFYDVDPDTQMKRIINRNGKEKAKMFKLHWIPLEEEYFSYYRIKELADIVIK